VLVLVWLAACVPLAVAEIPPLLDYPAHLARLHMLAGWDDLAAWHEYYQTAWGVLPNLALELVGVPLAAVFPATVALRLFTALVLGLLIWGGARLNRTVTGRWSATALLPALLAYNVILAFGFLNFLFGVGLALLALSFHIEVGEQQPARRLLRESGFMLALFFSHIVALAIYLVAAASHDLAVATPARRWRALGRDLAILAGGLVLPVLLLAISPTRGEASGLEIQSLSTKLDKIAAMPLTGSGGWDVLFAFLALGALAALLVTRRIRLDRTMAMVALGLALAFLVAPYRFASAENVDTRLPLAFLLVGLAGFVPRAGPSRALTAAVVLLLGFRIATVTVHYARSGQALEQVRADLRAIPAGSLVFTAIEASAPTWQQSDWDPPLPHASELLLLERPFFSVALFTNPTQQPLIRTRPFVGLDVPFPVGLVWQPHLEAYGKNLITTLDRAGRAEPVYLYFLKGPGRLIPGPHFEVILDRPRYAILRLLD
jgi:hypothetical protein